MSAVYPDWCRSEIDADEEDRKPHKKKESSEQELTELKRCERRYGEMQDEYENCDRRKRL